MSVLELPHVWERYQPRSIYNSLRSGFRREGADDTIVWVNRDGSVDGMANSPTLCGPEEIMFNGTLDCPNRVVGVGSVLGALERAVGETEVDRPIETDCKTPEPSNGNRLVIPKSSFSASTRCNNNSFNKSASQISESSFECLVASAPKGGTV